MAKLLSSLPIGASVKFGKHSVGSESAQPIVWVVADKNHSGYPSNSVTLLAKEVIDLRPFDGAESSYMQGNPNYGLSNINQWLNSSASAGAWYTAKHTGDTPPNSDNVASGTEYYTRPGFLYNFTQSERNALLTTTVSGVSTKVVIPSTTELGSTAQAEGSVLQYITTAGAVATLSTQAYNNTNYPSKSVGNSYYWTRTKYYDMNLYYVDRSGSLERYTNPYMGFVGLRPLINVSENLEISTIPDSEGCYTFSLTNAPTAPTNVQITTSPIYTTKPCSVKWDASTDPNGDVITYKVHLYYNGVESGSAADAGEARSYTLASVKSGVTTIGFGIEAVDSRGHSSAIVSTSSSVITNNLPIISGANTNLGVKTDGFSQTYTVSDADKTSVTVTEYIDTVKIRSYVATLDATNTFDVTGKTWLKLTNGIHTLKITATDGLDESTRTYTFTKTVNTLVVQRNTPLTSETKPTRLVATVVKNIPVEAIFKVEACNNGFDTTPAWEDITSSVTKGQAHVFTNSVKTAGQWGVNIRVTVNRNGGEGACYITEIGGNFE